MLELHQHILNIPIPREGHANLKALPRTERTKAVRHCLRELGIKGVSVTTAPEKELVDVYIWVPKFDCPTGRTHFDPWIHQDCAECWKSIDVWHHLHKILSQTFPELEFCLIWPRVRETAATIGEINNG